MIGHRRTWADSLSRSVAEEAERIVANNIGPFWHAAGPGGGTSALRGFRLQSLYTLHRLLCPGDSRLGELLQPEGAEDLAVFRGSDLREACQVKARGAALVLSDLEPEKKDGFFRRAITLVRAHPEMTIRLVSFGPVGPELSAAVAGAATERARVLTKLTGVGIRKTDAALVLDRMEVELVDEAQLLEGVQARVRETAAGHDAAAATQLLLFWMHEASEKTLLLDSGEVIERLAAVGRYLAERAAHAAEWFTTIEPLEDHDLTEGEKDRLAAEFANGVAAQFEHILAGAAIHRPDRLADIERILRTSRVAVVHGASGEGKTTIALSFLAALPSVWRFRVRDLEGPRHARSVARALLGHAQALQVPLYVHLDVGPADVGWPVLVRELSRDPEVRVIVTIREEDWRRTITDAEFPFGDVALSLAQDEAREIYAGLRERSDKAPPTFDDAWARFGGAPGPLLEFVHLCMQGVGLEERLHGQVRRLQDDVRDGRLQAEELELLRLVSVASAYEAGIDLVGAADALHLQEPSRTVERFEGEYLVRTSRDGRALVGLHPLRSAILVGQLTDPALKPWGVIAARVLPLIVDQHIDRFLLYSFARRPVEDQQLLRDELARYQARTWTGLAGIMRALLWRGLADYAETNRALFGEVREASPGFWQLLIDWDIGRVRENAADGMLSSLATTHPAFAEAAERAREYRERQTPPSDVFAPVRRWLATRLVWPAAPRGGAEWASLGEVALWARKLNIVIPTAEALDRDSWHEAIQESDIEDLANAAAGLAVEPHRPDWWSATVPELMDRFRSATQTPCLTDDGAVVSIEFLIDPEQRAGVSLDPHEEAVRRIELLRRLIPDRARYECRGHGHRLIDVGHDPTVKAIPAENLFPEAFTRLNGTFHNYIDRWYRVETWLDFWNRSLSQREAALQALRTATNLVTRYFRQQGRGPVGVEIDVVTAALAAIGECLPLPRSAVDEWGFVSESNARRGGDASPESTLGGLSVSPYLPFWRAYRDFLSSLDSFAHQAKQALILQTAVGRRAPGVEVESITQQAQELGIDEHGARLSLHNLVAARERLLRLQRMTWALAPIALERRLTALETAERATYDATTIAWRFLLQHPESRIADVVSTGRQERDHRVRRMRSALQDALQAAVPNALWSVQARLTEYEYEQALVVTGDWPSATASLGEIEPAVRAIGGALAAASEHDRQAIIETAPRILVLALIRGRPLAQEAVALHTLLLADPAFDPHWYGLVPRAIERDVLADLRIDRWNDPLVLLADPLLASIVTIWVYVQHLSDLQIPGDLDDLGTEIVRQHVDLTIRSLESALSSLLDRSSRLAEMLRGRATEPELVDALQSSVVELARTLTQGFRLGDIATLTGPLERAVFAVTIARSTWIDLALEEVASQTAASL